MPALLQGINVSSLVRASLNCLQLSSYEFFPGTFVVTYEKKKEGSTKLQKQALRKKNDTVNAISGFRGGPRAQISSLPRSEFCTI